MATTTLKNAPCAPDCKDLPVNCPDCGALECLCRPRFFAGQLLTEDDLNRLDQYIRGKHRLQNRNLHGWGVVNGLKVLCDPCGGTRVTVTEGYALDPCGNDIVVCCDASVDVCELIKRCKDRMREDVECTPFATSNTGCEDVEEEWILAMRYCEQPSRGITALRGGGCETVSECAPSAHCGNAGCGTCGTTGNCNCGGGCGPGSCPCNSDLSTRRATPRAAPPACEPTLICEGFRFEVFRKPPDEPRDPKSDDDDSVFDFGGGLVDQFNCCAEALTDAIPQPPGDIEPDVINAKPNAWYQWCCRTRKSLIDYLGRHPTTNCDLIRMLGNMGCPSPGVPGFAGRIIEATENFVMVLAEGIINCMCLALLPPAPSPTHDPRVALASVKVRGPKCEVVSICNWTDCRRILSTWPNMCYWWGVTPIRDIVRGAIHELCCSQLSFGRDPRDPNSTVDPATGEVVVPTNSEFDSVFQPITASPRSRATARLNPFYSNQGKIAATFDFLGTSIERGEQPLDAAAFASSISRLKLPSESGGGLSRMERSNLAPFLMLNAIGRPLANTALNALPRTGLLGGEGTLDAMGALFAGMADLDAGPADDPSVNARIDELEALVKSQQEAIDELSKRSPGTAKRSKKTPKKK